MNIHITEPQMSALECAGVFECEDPLATFIEGEYIEVTQDSADLVCELSNHLDALGHGRDESDEEKRKWYRRDAITLSNLFSKMNRKLR